MSIYKNTSRHDDKLPVSDIIPHRLNDIAYPPNKKEIDDLEVLIKKDGLIDPLEIDERDKKTIWSGHRRYRTLIQRFKVSEIPVIYVSVPEFDNDIEEITWLVTRNVKREEEFIDKYKYLKYIFKEHKKTYGNELDNDGKEYHCRLKGVSLDMYQKAEKVEYSGRADLWKKIVKGAKVNTIYKLWKKGDESNERRMEPSILRYLDKNKHILVEALSETASFMTQLANLERKDLEKNDGSTHKPFLKIQPNIIGGIVHEELTKNLGSILRRVGKDVETLNNNLADLTSLTESWDLETKTTLFDGTKLTFTSSKGWGAYYLLLGYTHEFDRFFLCIAKVPSSSWSRARGFRFLTTKEIHRIKKEDSDNYLQVLGGIGQTKGKFHCHLDPIS